MRTAEHGLDSLAEIDRRIGAMAAAGSAAGFVEGVRDYLASWSRQRILSMQQVDGGWGPFDASQQPVPMRGPDQILVIGDSLRRQREALGEAGIAPTAEFLELELFFSLARQVVGAWKRQQAAMRAAGAPAGGYRHWSDQREAAGHAP